jgi:hypothetical protein
VCVFFLQLHPQKKETIEKTRQNKTNPKKNAIGNAAELEIRKN